MKTGKMTKIAVAAAVTGAIVLPASGALAADKTERALIGAILGGVTGAAISKGDTGAVAMGAAAGALVGVATAKDRNHSRGYYQSRQYRQAQYRGYDNRYDNGYYGRYDTRYDRGYNDYRRW